MSRTPAKIISAALTLGLLAGCASTQVPTDVASTGMPNAEVALRRSLDQVNQDMAAIGSMRPVSYASTPSEPVVPAELQRPVQFVWVGPLDAGVRKLANSIGYSVAVTGPPTPQPVAVQINVSGQVISVFRALGEQAGSLATVRVDPLHHQIQVTHHV